jgi:carbonic anhydrase
MQHDSNVPHVTPDEALDRLKRGNERFQRGEARWLGGTEASRTALVAGQRPFATIIGCSDSRVPPELIFDVGLGELFVIRVAGNVVGTEVAGSIQYAGSHLLTPAFVVLGHEGCGAVEAALETRVRATRHKSRIHLLVESILPGIGEIDGRLSRAAQLSLAVERNVRWSMRQIAESPEGRARLAHGDIRLVGGIYEIASGRVRFLEDE